jgi:hypothetical protein
LLRSFANWDGCYSASGNYCSVSGT